MEELNGPGGSGTAVDAGPTVIQSLFDYTQTAIAPWGPVTEVIPVNVGGQIHVVNKLASRDPFTGWYQKANGDMFLSNAPLDQVLAGTTTAPAKEVWQSPDGPVEIYSNDLILTFVRTATEQDIAAFLSAENLAVVMSCFEPSDDPQAGNEVAAFHLSYAANAFTSIDAALTYFAAKPLVAQVVPNSLTCKPGYVQDQNPDDEFYFSQTANPQRRARHVTTLGVDSSQVVDIGPPDGNALSKVAVAVIDDGVYRNHEDYVIPGGKKISWLGMEYIYKVMDIKYAGGSPNYNDPGRPGAKVTHGTQSAGVITAATDNSGLGVPSLAPRIGVLPIRLEAEPNPNGGYQFSKFSRLAAYTKLMKTTKKALWEEDVRVVNLSIYGGEYVQGEADAIWLDAERNDRLYVAIAGNESVSKLVYPAAYPRVLGVSGLWVGPTNANTDWWTRTTFTPENPGSNYRDDEHLADLSRVYSVSGIYGFTNADRNEMVPQGYSTATTWTIPGGQPQKYMNFFGTSFAGPQVSALAALLLLKQPTKHYWEIEARLVTTRNMQVEAVIESRHNQNPSQNPPIAGPISFTQALSGW